MHYEKIIKQKIIKKLKFNNYENTYYYFNP